MDRQWVTFVVCEKWDMSVTCLNICAIDIGLIGEMAKNTIAIVFNLSILIHFYLFTKFQNNIVDVCDIDLTFPHVLTY